MFRISVYALKNSRKNALIKTRVVSNYSTNESTQKPVIISDETVVLLTTRQFFEDKTIVKEIGVVSGSSVQSRTFFHDLWSRVLGFFGGEVISYSELLSRATSDATRSLMIAAAKNGANGVVKISYQMNTTSDPTAGVFCYALAYGTAVVVEDNKNPSKDKVTLPSDE
eukprot:TRINITY_DN12402_c0_g1_i1.p1 TRINITY_DN12402_c0_g1~~TRINITY_DN12402_c0_g1_i1.p1  ORF type:complete len:168 (+),score=19.69 TRINITY_DN12402_c0_g1_i1:44-547(+)